MNRSLNAAHFFALLSVAASLGPALAHLFELPNKIRLGRDEYFTVQQIYRGWALLGVLVVAALISTTTLAVMTRKDPRVLPWVLVALAGLVGAQAVFWTLTYPVNVATENWTTMPENWESARTRWEYSHAAGAVLTLAAMIALIVSALARAWRADWRALSDPSGITGNGRQTSR